MLRIIATTVSMTLLILADGSVLQTGQTKSYDADNNIVTDGSIKDDGYYQVGAARSYSRWGDVVTDTITGLEWQDYEIISKPWVSAENWINHNYNDTSDDTAVNYCLDLPLQGGGWRLPYIEELQTLVDYSQVDPATTQGVFDRIDSGYYWSSDTYVYDFSYAWFLNFKDGMTHWSSFKNHSNYVRCVRGVQFAYPLYRIDEIVFDNATGLQWQMTTSQRLQNELGQKRSITVKMAFHWVVTMTGDYPT